MSAPFPLRSDDRAGLSGTPLQLERPPAGARPAPAGPPSTHPLLRADGGVRLRGLLLDKDGTLFDIGATWASWCEGFIAAESRGDPTLGGALAEVMGFDRAASRFRPDSLLLTCPTALVAERLAPLLGVDAIGLAARMDAEGAGVAQVEAAPLAPLLARLSELGLALGLVTNDAEGSARAHVAHVAGRFAFVAGCDSGWGSKPDPGQLLAFARAADLPPACCAMVGDSPLDLLAARAAGMLAVAVSTGLSEAATLAPHADVMLGSIAELPDWAAPLI
jgi:phosphoglycolate phosphatase